MESVLARFRLAMEGLGPVPAGARLLVALSGGSDSVALLALALAWREGARPDVGLVAGHLDHGLRGEASQGDAAYCRELAGGLGIELIAEAEDVAARARRARISIETAGRDARLEAFGRWARDRGCSAVLTAHHRDDQVETILAHVMRGTGLRGLCGMPLRRPLRTVPGVELWRPCLAITREELAAYRRSLGLGHREDETNRAEAATRNRIRHRLLPALRARTEVDARILGLAAGASALESARRAALAPFIERVRIVPPHAAVPPEVIDAIAGSGGLADALFAEVWERSQGRPGALTRAHYQGWRRFAARAGDGCCLDLPRGAVLERAGGWLVVLGERAPGAPVGAPALLPPRGSIRWRGVRIEVGGELPSGALLGSLPDGPPLRVRGARPDDRIRAGGIRHRVSEWLRVAGIPARWRGEYPVVTSGDAVCWVPGIRPPAVEGPRRVRVVPQDPRDPIAFLLALRAESSGEGPR